MLEELAESLTKLALACILVGVIVLMSYSRKIGVGKDFLSAALRGFIQLMLLSTLLAYVFLSNLWFIYALPLLAVMAVLAGYTSARRIKSSTSPISRAMAITTPSITVGATFSLSTLIAVGVIPLRPEFVIPLAGMAFGNAMNSCSLTLNRLLSEIKNNRNKIEALLALGATSEFAARQYEKTAIKWALIPPIDNLRTLGLIFIPGTMTGMLMAGISPITAAVYQLSIFFMIISSGIITAVIAVNFARAKVFTSAHQLEDLD